ncbi:MAG TPA: histidine phosphatase family protein [Thermoanaerobaculia bacterium]|nr:histidine phosphatase family protein [Thermoanaerobaculia bacterium]
MIGTRASALVALLTLAFHGACAASAQRESAADGITVYLLRHAEKIDESDESGLTELGRARAEALAGQLAHEPIVVVLASQFPRTRLTVTPLAGRLGLDVETIDAHAYDDVVARVRELAPGQAAVVSGHSNTIPEIAARLGVTPPLREDEVVYGALWVVRLAGGRAALERRRYGDP